MSGMDSVNPVLKICSLLSEEQEKNNMQIFLVLGFFLLSLNVLLVIFIRSGRTFAIFPGGIYTLLFFCFGAYLIYMLVSYTAPGVALHPVKQKPSNGVTNPVAEEKYLDKSIKQEKKYIEAQKERENKIKDDLIVINYFLNFLALQSIFSAIAAIVGSRVVKANASYYYGFFVLHVFLTIGVLIAKFLVNKEIH